MLPIDNDAAIITYNTTLKATYKGKEVPPGPYHSAGAWVNRARLQAADGKPMPTKHTSSLATERAAATVINSSGE